MAGPEKPAVTIAYCTRCNWLLRAGWMAQELCSTFGEELESVALVPGTGGSSRSGWMVSWSGSASATVGFRT